METCYRIEHKNLHRNSNAKIGIGCYTIAMVASSFYGYDSDECNKANLIDSRLRFMYSDHSNYSHPCMWEDAPNPNDFHDLFCAFKSLEDLYTWFDGWLNVLTENDFDLVEYHVTNIIESKSGKQCFIRERDVINKIV